MVPGPKGNQQNPTMNSLNDTLFIHKNPHVKYSAQGRYFLKVPMFMVFLMIIIVVVCLSLPNKLKFS